MVTSLQRPKAAVLASFGLAILAMVVTPKEIGYQELAALVARQQVVIERTSKRGFSSPFGTIHAANFSMPRPISSAMPAPLGYVLAGLDSANADITGSIRDRMLGEVMAEMAFEGRPSFDRRLKGDRLNGSADSIARAGEPQWGRKGDRFVPIKPSITEAEKPPEVELPIIVLEPDVAPPGTPPSNDRQAGRDSHEDHPVLAIAPAGQLVP